MRKLLPFLLLFLCAIMASAQNTAITASHIDTFGGAPITGTFCLTPTDANGNPVTVVTSTGQQFAPLPGKQLCFPVAAGVLSGAVVPDTSVTQPANVCYRLRINNSAGQVVGSYPCIQPRGSTWSFDGYVPGSTPVIPTLTGGSNENLSFSSTPTFSLLTSSSRISLSGNITTFTLAAGYDGQPKCLEFAHDGTMTTYTVTPPANVIGFMLSVGLKRAQQCFTYFTADALWVANNPGVISQ